MIVNLLQTQCGKVCIGAEGICIGAEGVCIGAEGVCIGAEVYLYRSGTGL